MKYGNYLERVSKRFHDRFSEIDPHWNFDQGNEFEIALATLVDELLPDKYGVCRGFVTPMDGDPKGDDVIIYDKMAAPLVKPHSSNQFSIKESVPLEAVYAYIEAKNTIELTDENKGTHLKKAISQTTAVRSLERKSRLHSEFADGVIIPNIVATKGPGAPDILNPMFTVVFARGLRINGKLTTNLNDIKAELTGFDTGSFGPDLIVLGEDIVVVPHKIKKNSMDEVESLTYEGPFCIDSRHSMMIWDMPKLAYGFGLISILYALQNIQLAPMQWLEVLGEPLRDADSRSKFRRDGRSELKGFKGN